MDKSGKINRRFRKKQPNNKRDKTSICRKMIIFRKFLPAGKKSFILFGEQGGKIGKGGCGFPDKTVEIVILNRE